MNVNGGLNHVYYLRCRKYKQNWRGVHPRHDLNQLFLSAFREFTRKLFAPGAEGTIFRRENLIILAHDRKFVSKIIKYSWNISSRKYVDRITIGNKFWKLNTKRSILFYISKIRSVRGIALTKGKNLFIKIYYNSLQNFVSLLERKIDGIIIVKKKLNPRYETSGWESMVRE